MTKNTPEYLIKDVLKFLPLTKNKNKIQNNQASLEKQLQAMAEDLEIQTEIKNIEQEFSTTEMDGLN